MEDGSEPSALKEEPRQQARTRSGTLKVATGPFTSSARLGKRAPKQNPKPEGWALNPVRKGGGSRMSRQKTSESRPIRCGAEDFDHVPFLPRAFAATT